MKNTHLKNCKLYPIFSRTLMIFIKLCTIKLLRLYITDFHKFQIVQTQIIFLLLISLAKIFVCFLEFYFISILNYYSYFFLIVTSIENKLSQDNYSQSTLNTLSNVLPHNLQDILRAELQPLSQRIEEMNQEIQRIHNSINSSNTHITKDSGNNNTISHSIGLPLHRSFQPFPPINAEYKERIISQISSSSSHSNMVSSPTSNIINNNNITPMSTSNRYHNLVLNHNSNSNPSSSTSFNQRKVKDNNTYNNTVVETDNISDNNLLNSSSSSSSSSNDSNNSPSSVDPSTLTLTLPSF